MKTYVISLGPAAELRRTIEDSHLVPGVRGSEASGETIRTATTPFWASFGPKSAVGCAMSHLNAWKTFLRTGEPHALFVEDDVVLQEGWRERVAASLAEPFDLLYLGCLGCDPAHASPVWTLLTSAVGIRAPYRRAARGLDSTNGLVSPGIALGMHAYVLSRSGAETLVRELDGNVYNHIDYCVQLLAKKGAIERRMMLPRVAYQTSTDTAISTNVSSEHPLILSRLLRGHSIDTMCRANYLATLSVGRIHRVNLTLFSLFFFLLGLLLRRLPLRTLTIAFFLLSAYDVASGRFCPWIVLTHYLLFVLPSLLHRLFKLKRPS